MDDRMAMTTQPRRAVVLGGGGSKGSYEVGVWQALHELGMDWQVVTGTSVGALNGALMALGKLDEALEMWRELDNTKVMAQIPATGPDESALREVYRAFMNQMLKNGGVDISPLEATVRALVDENALRTGSTEFGIVTVEFPALRAVEWFLPQIPQGRVADFLLASAACYPAFRPKEIDGTTFIDGGYTNNIPVDLALRAQTHVDEVIAVDVEGIGIVRRTPNAVPVTTLRCYWSLGNILIFDRDICRRNIRLGYLDTMKVFGELGGMAYTFEKGECDGLIERHLEPVSRCCLLLLERMELESKRTLAALVSGRLVNAATWRRMAPGAELDLRELLVAGGELAAELLVMDPTVLYTAESFDAALLDAFGKLSASADAILRVLGSNHAPNLAGLFASWKKEHLLAVCVHLVHRVMMGESTLSPQLMATLMPREFLAAVYLEAALHGG